MTLSMQVCPRLFEISVYDGAEKEAASFLEQYKGAWNCGSCHDIPWETQTAMIHNPVLKVSHDHERISTRTFKYIWSIG
jgi:hypothetical protein